MSDIFREAEDELRKETAESVAKRAAPFLIGAVVLALIGGGGWQLYQGQQTKNAQAASVAYDAAMGKLQAGDLPGGEAALAEIVKTAPSGFAAQAALQRGAVLQEQGKTAEARAAFDEAAKAIRDPDLADLARLRAAYIASDSETREQLTARLNPIIERKSAFAPLARELLAAKAWDAGDSAGARATYSLLQLDINAPEGVRTRAGQAIAVIDAAATKSATPMVIPEQQGAPGAPAQGGQPTPEQIAAMQAQMQQQAAAQNAQGEGTAAAPRIVRLPPGVKLPPGTKLPPNVRVIETPLPPGAGPPANAQQGVSPEVLAQIERERQASMARQKATTEAQQRQIQEIERARTAPPPSPAPAPAPAKADDANVKQKQPEPAPEPKATPPAPTQEPKAGGGQ